MSPIADNVAITAGSGTTIAADELTDGTLGSVKVQYVKLMDGTLDGSTKAAVGANGLAVDVKAIAAGTNAIGKLAANAGVNIGDVRNRPTVVRTRVASASLTTVTTAYTIGDQAGTMLSFSGAASANGGTGTVMSAVLLDKGDVGTDYRLHFFRSNVTLASDNAAFAVSDADMQDHCGVVTMPSMLDVGANRITNLGNIGLGYDTGAGTTLYVAIETRTANAVYAAATDLNLTLTLLLD